MKRFLLKLTILALPFLIVLVPFLIVGLYTGELTDYDTLIEKQRQRSDSCLVGMAYSNQTAYYKLSGMQECSPEIVSLGTSRVMQLRDSFFNVAFYNAGGAVNMNYDEYVNFLENADLKSVKVILLGLDSWIFNDNYNSISCTAIDSYTEINKKQIVKGSVLKSMILDYLNHKWCFEDFLDIGDCKENIGFSGILKEDGFMPDGSHYYGYIYDDPANSGDAYFLDTYERIETGSNRFEYGDSVDPETVQLLDELLSYCNEAHIQVFAFIPPFAPSVYQTMEQSGKYSYMNDIYGECLPIFAQYGYELYDFQDVSSLGIDDSFFVDGFHGSEVTYAMMLQEMCKHSDLLEQYINLGLIQSELKERDSNLVLQWR